MKKILSIATVAVLLLSSCGKEFITAIHNSSEPIGEYFTTEERISQSLVAAYDPLQWFDYFYQYDALNLVSDIMADDLYCGGSNEGDQPILTKTHLYTATPDQCCNQIWTIAYSGVNRACVVLEHIDDVPNLDPTLKARYIAEAKVLKTYYYTILWKFWGNIPYYDQNLVDPYRAPQLGHDEVYARMLVDLEAAIAAKVLPMKAAAGSEGRVTEAMAKMLYAEAVMYQCDQTRYQTALDYMLDIINSNQYALVDDFGGIWEESGEWCRESIWEINYMKEGFRSWDSPIAAGGSVYPCLIGIPGGDGDYFNGWGFGPVATSAYNMYDDTDIRRDGGILDYVAYATEKGYIDGYTPRWQATGYYLKKYIARKNGNAGYKGSDTMNFGNNYRVYRYSETLLNAAELSVLLGKDGSSYLQQVRNRAKSKDTGVTRDDIIEERHKEFVGEGKRYWDLIRSGLAGTVLKASNHEYRTIDWTESKKYWPIPQSEKDKDPDLVQNQYNN